MDTSLLLKLIGLGLLVTVGCQVLSKSGRDEQSTMLSVAGIIIAMVLILKELSGLISTISALFGLKWAKLSFVVLFFVSWHYALSSKILKVNIPFFYEL